MFWYVIYGSEKKERGRVFRRNLMSWYPGVT